MLDVNADQSCNISVSSLHIIELNTIRLFTNDLFVGFFECAMYVNLCCACHTYTTDIVHSPSLFPCSDVVTLFV